MKLDAIKQEPKKRFKNILNILINSFKGARYNMRIKMKISSQIKAKILEVMHGKDFYGY
jgi:hypothetical protein